MRTDIDDAQAYESGAGFVVHSPMLAIKSLTRQQVYVTLNTGTFGEILEMYGPNGSSGLVLINVRGEFLLTWKRDLEERAEIVRAPQSTASLIRLLPRKNMSRVNSQAVLAELAPCTNK